MFRFAGAAVVWMLVQSGGNPVGVQRFLEKIADEMQALVDKLRREAQRLAKEERQAASGNSEESSDETEA